MHFGSRQVQLGRFFAATLSALTLVGCGSGHVGPGAGGSASASFSWSIYDVGDTTYRTPLSCASVGAGQVVLTLISQDTGHTYSTAAAAPCSVGQATTYGVPAGYYTVGFDLYGDPEVYKNSTTLIDSFDSTDTFYLYAGSNTDYRNPSEAFFTRSLIVGWNIYSQGAPALCAAGETVDLEFFTPGATDWVTSTFDCAAYAGTSFPYPVDAASTQWRMYLVSAAGADLGTIAGGSVGLSLHSDINLGTQSFSVAYH
jgi:hypothetical protein